MNYCTQPENLYFESKGKVKWELQLLQMYLLLGNARSGLGGRHLGVVGSVSHWNESLTDVCKAAFHHSKSPGSPG
jgi:hypothetical protein